MKFQITGSSDGMVLCAGSGRTAECFLAHQHFITYHCVSQRTCTGISGNFATLSFLSFCSLTHTARSKCGQKIQTASASTQVSHKATASSNTHHINIHSQSLEHRAELKTRLNGRLKIFCLRARDDEFDAFLGVCFNEDLPDHRVLFWEMSQCQ